VGQSTFAPLSFADSSFISPSLSSRQGLVFAFEVACAPRPSSNPSLVTAPASLSWSPELISGG